MKKNLGLYIHIPFCKTLCHYCDFCKFINQKDEIIEKYMLHLIDEINEYKEYFDKITTIYIGGGTPNSIDFKYLNLLFKALESINPIEYSIETNVEYINKDFVDLLKSTKINRISIGVQTFNKQLIKEINRFHDEKMCIKAVELLKENGYENINIDLIYGIKNQTIKHVEYDLEMIKKLNIKHVSYYSLILEENSVFGRKYPNLDGLINEDLEANMNEFILQKMKEIEFNHYEISNFSKKNYESIHNKLYWKREEYIACGASAASYFNNKNKTNSPILSRYFNNEFDESITSLEEQKQQYFWLGLRLINGVDLSKYEEKYNENPIEKFKINILIENELVMIKDDFLMLTPKGILLANIVFRHFII